MFSALLKLASNYLFSLILTQDSRQTEPPIFPWLWLMLHKAPLGEALFALQLAATSHPELPMLSSLLAARVILASVFFL